MRQYVNVLHGKNTKRFVVHCPKCPLSIPLIEGHNQKTACLHIRIHSKKAVRQSHKMKKENQCDWYLEDSIRREPNGISSIDCIYGE